MGGHFEKCSALHLEPYTYFVLRQFPIDITEKNYLYNNKILSDLKQHTLSASRGRIM